MHEPFPIIPKGAPAVEDILRFGVFEELPQFGDGVYEFFAPFCLSDVYSGRVER